MNKCVLLLVLVSVASPGATPFVMHGPAYKFQIAKGKGVKLCDQMSKVLNKRFRHMWDTPMNDPVVYSEKSSYAFPRAPNAPFDADFTYQYRYARFPSMPEVMQIDWREVLIPNEGTDRSDFDHALVAQFDLDNSGIDDTVLKLGGATGYADMAHSKSSSADHEGLLVWRDRKVDVSSEPLSKLINNSAISKGPWFVASAALLRPFHLKGVTYALKMDMDLGPDNAYVSAPPHLPKEQMNIVKIWLTDNISEGGVPRPLVEMDTLCTYRMIQQVK